MATPVVVIGIGQLGSVFSQGFLRLGRPVFPVVRGVLPSAVETHCPEPDVVVVAVAENDLDPVLADLPAAWKKRLVLLQNELLPHVWQRHGIGAPTVAVVWFEKKKGIDINVLRPTVLCGPQARLTAEALAMLAIPTRRLSDPAELVCALVCKNVFVLTVNIAGLVTGGTTGALWSDHRDLAFAVAAEVFTIQQRLSKTRLDRDLIMRDLEAAMVADPHHRCAGRSALQRLERTMAAAAALGLSSDTLRGIQQRVLPNPDEPEPK